MLDDSSRRSAEETAHFARCFPLLMRNRENAAQVTDSAPENPPQNPT
jgi:hypothetical protein